MPFFFFEEKLQEIVKQLRPKKKANFEHPRKEKKERKWKKGKKEKENLKK